MAALVERGETKNTKFRRKAASIISGSSAGAVVSLVLQPLDVIRTQLQAQAVAEGKVLTRTVVTTAKDLWLEGGFRNFWRGSGRMTPHSPLRSSRQQFCQTMLLVTCCNLLNHNNFGSLLAAAHPPSDSGSPILKSDQRPTVWRLSLGLGLQFLTLETLTDAILSRRAAGLPIIQPLDHKSRELGKLEAFFAGGIARGVAAAATVPFTIAKTRMEYQGPNAQIYKSTFSVLGTIIKREGITGIFRGIGPTIMTNAPFSALYYMFYSDLRRRLQPEGKTTSLVNFTSGTFAAIAATLLTQPTDMIRTQMQLGNAKNAGLGSVAMLRKIVASKGAGVLLAGAAPRVLKRTLQTALVWTIYEELKPFLMQQAERFSSEKDS